MMATHSALSSQVLHEPVASVLLGLDPATYIPHPVHQPSFGYPETNCWTDLMIELLHASGHEPLAGLGCTLALGHEDDQFTFFKPRAEELERLYGVDVHEFQPYRALAAHIGAQSTQGSTLIVEVDGWWLPDTAGISYRSNHVKTAIAIASLTRDRLVYFHNAGLYELTGEDLTQVLAPSALPGYVEIVRFHAGSALTGAALRDRAVEILQDNLRRRPSQSPFVSFGEQLDRELDEVLALPAQQIHMFAFATTRMAGAAMALAGAHARYLYGDKADEVANAFEAASATSRILTMRLMRRKPFDPAPFIDTLNSTWSKAHGRLDTLVA